MSHLSRMFVFFSYITFFFMSISAFAATATGSFMVSATVNTACSLNINNLDFGDYDPFSLTATDATTTLNITCTNTTPYTVALDAGTGDAATVATRKMTYDSNTLNYSLYQDAARSIVWGDSQGTNTIAGIGTGSEQSVTLYGRIPIEQNVPPGTYVDIVTVTITY